LSIKELPQRGEVWLVNLDPTVGTEIRKTRPAVVVSSNTIGAVDTLQLRGLDEQRFLRKLGTIEDEVMMRIAAAIALVVEYQP
jgi:mRNA interferase MazF